jgi:hypothetical protein
MQNKRPVIDTVLMAIGIISILSIYAVYGNAIPNAYAQSTMNTTSPSQPGGGTITRDSVTVLLDTKQVPPKDFIHLYDTTPYKIVNGHIAAKLPIDQNNQTQLQILVGQAPNLKPAELEFVRELSTPGKMGIFHVDLPQGNDTTTDIAILNPTNQPITMPDTSGVTIGINEIMPVG